MHITDRRKDMIKSGGEWIGSIDLENIAMGYPGVAMVNYEGKVATWWTPDDVVFVDAIPLGATGQMLKQALRAQ